MTLDCEVVITREGAKAILDRTTGQVMHPVVGPEIEADRIYIQPSRLEERLCAGSAADRPLVLLDVGLGAGSNAIAAWRVCEALPASARRLEIVSLDRSLAALSLALAPEHASAFGFVEAAGAAALSVLSTGRHETPRTTWRVVVGDVTTTLDLEAAASVDLVFWDPFSPRVNGELWTVSAFRALFRACHADSYVLTYGGATAARSALLLAGFVVGEGIELGHGKRATCASMRVEDLERPLDRRWLERLARSSAPFPPDAPVDALERIGRLAQLAGTSSVTRSAPRTQNAGESRGE